LLQLLSLVDELLLLRRMNDPNGLFYDPVHKKHHIMYQWCEGPGTPPNNGATGTPCTYRAWGHAASANLLSWTQLDVALDPNATGAAGLGVCGEAPLVSPWSGSATVLDDPQRTPVLSFAPPTGCDAIQVISSPDGLTNWSLASTAEHPSRHCSACTSRNCTTCTSKACTGRLMPGKSLLMAMPSFVECPGFSKLPQRAIAAAGVPSKVSHLIKASFRYLNDGRTKAHGDFWATGKYDDAIVRFTPHGERDLGSAGRTFDFSGNTYAGKSFYDTSTDRQIFYSWLAFHGPRPGLVGVQTLPREILLDSDGVRVRTPPIAELQRLRGKHSRAADVSVSAGASYPLAEARGGSLEVLALLHVPSGVFDCAMKLGAAAGLQGTVLGLSREASGAAVIAYLVPANSSSSHSAALPATVDLMKPVPLQVFLVSFNTDSYLQFRSK
jgi:sucrose-6-phosphate hydrolase SacC (GH32 family)